MDKETLVVAAVIAAGALASIFLILTFVRHYLYICAPDQVLIFSGGRYKLRDGSHRGFRVTFGGRAFRTPLVETVDQMSLNVMEVPIAVRNAYSKGGIPLNVDAMANIKISSNPLIIHNAIERFLGRDQKEIQRVAKETLEGHLRGVLATLTPEEVNEDRLKFAGELSHESEQDLNKLGIHLDLLKILHVADEAGYLDSIGREAIANVIRDAEIAESDSKRDAEQAEASNLGRARVTTSNVDAKVAQMTNELRKVTAEWEAKVKAEEERTTAAAREARALAEQELQQVRAELEGIRLKADTVLPAVARKQAREFAARGAAAQFREQGRAVGQVIELWNQAWTDAGKDALSIHLIQELEEILARVAKGAKKVQIENLSLIDGGDGATISSYLSAYPAMIKVLFDAVHDTTGIDIPGVVSGNANGGVR